jgi:hypothetical protein
MSSRSPWWRAEDKNPKPQACLACIVSQMIVVGIEIGKLSNTANKEQVATTMQKVLNIVEPISYEMHTCTPQEMHTCTPQEMHTCTPQEMHTCTPQEMHSRTESSAVRENSPVCVYDKIREQEHKTEHKDISPEKFKFGEDEDLTKLLRRLEEHYRCECGESMYCAPINTDKRKFDNYVSPMRVLANSSKRVPFRALSVNNWSCKAPYNCNGACMSQIKSHEPCSGFSFRCANDRYCLFANGSVITVCYYTLCKSGESRMFIIGNLRDIIKQKCVCYSCGNTCAATSV